MAALGSARSTLPKTGAPIHTVNPCHEENFTLAATIVALLPAYTHASVTLWWRSVTGDPAQGFLVLDQPIGVTQTITEGYFDPLYPYATRFNLAGLTWLGDPVLAVRAFMMRGYDGDFALDPTGTGPLLQEWYFFDIISHDELRGKGRWEVVVPEPSSRLAGTLVLLPMAAQALRFFRKQRMA